MIFHIGGNIESSYASVESYFHLTTEESILIKDNISEWEKLFYLLKCFLEEARGIDFSFSPSKSTAIFMVMIDMDVQLSDGVREFIYNQCRKFGKKIPQVPIFLSISIGKISID